MAFRLRHHRSGVTHVLAAGLVALTLAACASAPETPVAEAPHAPADAPAAAYVPGAGAHIVETGGNLQCVAYARAIGNVQIFGDAWTWWESAAGQYDRGQLPRVGAVLVLKRRGASLGHVAVVRQIVDSRIVIAEHANWLNRHEIQMNSAILDVSPGNDWSAVRVWYTPGGHWGGGVYPAYGFIYPTQVAGL